MRVVLGGCRDKVGEAWVVAGVDMTMLLDDRSAAAVTVWIDRTRVHCVAQFVLEESVKVSQMSSTGSIATFKQQVC